MRIIRDEFFLDFAYPCWPDDFVWSNDGLPPNCNCGPNSTNPTSNPVCRCNCIKIHSSKSDESWNNNLLCFRDTKFNPRLILSKKSKFDIFRITIPFFFSSYQRKWYYQILCILIQLSFNEFHHGHISDW